MERSRILALVASPRKNGNTDTLTKQLMESASLNGANVETIYLVDKTVKPCIQCEYCHQDKDNKCNIDDDFNMIAEKMIESDIIVFATPIWWSSMHSLLKLLLDRCYSLLDKNWSNFKLQGKGCVVIACQTQEDINLYVNPLVKEFIVYEDWLKIKVIDSLVASAEAKGEVASNTELIDKAKNLGVVLANWSYKTV